LACDGLADFGGRSSLSMAGMSSGFGPKSGSPPGTAGEGAIPAVPVADGVFSGTGSGIAEPAGTPWLCDGACSSIGGNVAAGADESEAAGAGMERGADEPDPALIACSGNAEPAGAGIGAELLRV
jgi:hypothetical protein